MRNKLALALAMAMTACGAWAEDWHFTYTGFDVDGRFVNDATVAGSFSGSDLDMDGKLALAELTSLVIEGRQFLNGCLSLSDPYFRCEIYEFDYALTGQLNASLMWWGNDEGFSGWGESLHTGDSYSMWSYGWSSWSQTYVWTGDTKFAITPLPVPEPASGTMWLAGLATLAGLGRRWGKKNQAAPVLRGTSRPDSWVKSVSAI